jgi:hypothetical protein
LSTDSSRCGFEVVRHRPPTQSPIERSAPHAEKAVVVRSDL